MFAQRACTRFMSAFVPVALILVAAMCMFAHTAFASEEGASALRIAPATANTYAIVKSDGYLHRTNATHTIDYGSVWGGKDSEAREALKEVTVLFVDADVESLDKVLYQYQSGSTYKDKEVNFNGMSMDIGPENLVKVEFLLKDGKNSCSQMKNWYMFGKQPNLTEVINFDKTQLATIPSGCFYQCSKLASIKLPPTTTMIGNSAFFDCDSLKVLDLPASTIAIGTSSWNDAVIGRCDKLEKLILRANSTVVVQRDQLRDTNPNLKIYVPNGLLSSYTEQVNSNGWYRYGDHRSKFKPFLEVANIADQKYTGNAVKPVPSVTWIGSKITSGFTTTYSNNVNPGFATAKVSKEDCIVSKTFKITTVADGSTEAAISEGTVSVINKKKGAGGVAQASSKTMTTFAIPAKKQMRVEWVAVKGATNYIVGYKRSSDKLWSYVVTGGATKHTFSGMSEGSMMEFRVAVYDKSKMARSEWTATNCRFCREMVSLKATAGSGKIALRWSKVSGATGYQVLVSTNKNLSGAKVITVNGASKTSYTVTGLTKGKTYYVKMRAIRGTTNVNGKFNTYVGIHSGLRTCRV